MTMTTINIDKVGTYKVIASNSITGFSSVSNEVKIFSLNRRFHRLKDIFPRPSSLGIFQKLSTIQNSQLAEFLTATFERYLVSMDTEYIYTHSGEKLVSVMMENMLCEDKDYTTTYPLTDIQWTIISRNIENRYLNKWKELLKTIEYKYDFLSPFDIVFDENMSDTLASTSDKEYTDTESQNDNIYAFNAANNPTPTDKADNTYTGTSSDRYNRTNTHERNTTRRGNIGNTSRQELTEQQRNVLQWQMQDVIFADIDKIFTCPKF